MAVDITDIREGKELSNLAAAIKAGLQPNRNGGCRTLPSLLLWDETGLKHFEEVTYSPDYYLTNTEIALLEAHSGEIAKDIQPNSIVLELGSGALRKTEILLNAFERMGKRVDYYALDLDKSELERTLRELDPARFRYVRCHGLFGTYEDGHAWVSKPETAVRPRCILSLGSTIGSFSREEASDFWYDWGRALQRRDSPIQSEETAESGAIIVIGLDACKHGAKVFGAYNDRPGANSRFILNALDHANVQLGYEAFVKEDFAQQGEWNAEAGRHDQYLVPRKDIDFEGRVLKKGERIYLVSSYKYDEDERANLWHGSQLKEVSTYTNEDHSYGLHVLSPM